MPSGSTSGCEPGLIPIDGGRRRRQPGSMNATTADAGSTTVNDQPAARQLRRSTDDKMLGGVAGGIARYLNADVTLVRIIIAALALFTSAGASEDGQRRDDDAHEGDVGVQPAGEAAGHAAQHLVAA